MAEGAAMKTNIPRALPAPCVALLAALLAGCGGKDGPPKADAPAPGPSAPSTSSAPPGPAKAPEAKAPQAKAPQAKRPAALPAADLVKAFREDRDAAGKRYGARPVTVEGVVKEVNRGDG